MEAPETNTNELMNDSTEQAELQISSNETKTITDNENLKEQIQQGKKRDNAQFNKNDNVSTKRLKTIEGLSNVFSNFIRNVYESKDTPSESLESLRMESINSEKSSDVIPINSGLPIKRTKKSDILGNGSQIISVDTITFVKLLYRIYINLCTILIEKITKNDNDDECANTNQNDDKKTIAKLFDYYDVNMLNILKNTEQQSDIVKYNETTGIIIITKNCAENVLRDVADSKALFEENEKPLIISRIFNKLFTIFETRRIHTTFSREALRFYMVCVDKLYDILDLNVTKCEDTNIQLPFTGKHKRNENKIPKRNTKSASILNDIMTKAILGTKIQATCLNKRYDERDIEALQFIKSEKLKLPSDSYLHAILINEFHDCNSRFEVENQCCIKPDSYIRVPFQNSTEHLNLIAITKSAVYLCHDNLFRIAPPHYARDINITCSLMQSLAELEIEYVIFEIFDHVKSAANRPIKIIDFVTLKHKSKNINKEDLGELSIMLMEKDIYNVCDLLYEDRLNIIQKMKLNVVEKVLEDEKSENFIKYTSSYIRKPNDPKAVDSNGLSLKSYKFLMPVKNAIIVGYDHQYAYVAYKKNIEENKMCLVVKQKVPINEFLTPLIITINLNEDILENMLEKQLENMQDTSDEKKILTFHYEFESRKKRSCKVWSVENDDDSFKFTPLKLGILIKIDSSMSVVKITPNNTILEKDISYESEYVNVANMSEKIGGNSYKDEMSEYEKKINSLKSHPVFIKHFLYILDNIAAEDLENMIENNMEKKNKKKIEQEKNLDDNISNGQEYAV